MKNINIAILGLGTVGGGTYEALRDNREEIRKNYGVDINVKKILELNPARGSLYNVPEGLITKDFNEIVSDPDISIVAELIGGVTYAKEFIIKALESKKTVVSANKELIAKHWSEIEAAARRNNVGFYYEASCVGGVPVIRVLNESMQANKIGHIIGIFNGTTNYILSKMSEEGWDYDFALKTAQELGYAEADPTSDVDGYDTMYKLSILSSMAFHASIPYKIIYREGISKISARDIAGGKELGYVIKLLAIAKRRGSEVEVRVHPTFVPKEHPLASVSGSFNAVHIRGDYVGDIMLYGRGAGAHPTASAVASDIVYAANAKTHIYSTFKNNGEKDESIILNNDFKTKYYIRLDAADRAGVMATVTAVFGEYDISISAMRQKEADGGVVEVMFLTHETGEKSMMSAIEKIKELEYIAKVTSIIRVI